MDVDETDGFMYDYLRVVEHTIDGTLKHAQSHAQSHGGSSGSSSSNGGSGSSGSSGCASSPLVHWGAPFLAWRCLITSCSDERFVALSILHRLAPCLLTHLPSGTRLGAGARGANEEKGTRGVKGGKGEKEANEEEKGSESGVLYESLLSGMAVCGSIFITCARISSSTSSTAAAGSAAGARARGGASSGGGVSSGDGSGGTDLLCHQLLQCSVSTFAALSQRVVRLSEASQAAGRRLPLLLQRRVGGQDRDHPLGALPTAMDTQRTMFLLHLAYDGSCGTGTDHTEHTGDADHTDTTQCMMPQSKLMPRGALWGAAADILGGVYSSSSSSVYSGLGLLTTDGSGGGGGGGRRFTTPLYTQASPSTIQDRLAQALSQMSAEYRLKDASPHTVKATVMVPGGRVDIKLQTYQVNAQTDGGATAATTAAAAAAAAATAGGGGAVCLSTTRTAPLFAVQILRQRGSILQFQEVYRALCDQLGDIVALPPTQGGGEGGGGSGDDGGGDGGNAQDAAAGGAAARGIDRMSLK